jgi:hypothetical protein
MNVHAHTHKHIGTLISNDIGIIYCAGTGNHCYRFSLESGKNNIKGFDVNAVKPLDHYIMSLSLLFFF